MSLDSPKKLLERFGLSPKYSFGQNFLSDVRQVERIAKLAAPEPGAAVLELGAGLGALTEQLLLRGASVVAIERDRDLVPALNELFQDAVSEGTLQIIEDDAKTSDWAGILAALSGDPSRGVLCGNLPYQITGPLLERAVALAPHIERAVFLVQKEVADRLSAVPGTKAYGALSVFVQASFSVKRAVVIKAGAFYPPPRVDSAVVVLTRRDERVAETQVFRRLVKAAFAARRKTLRNAWKAIAPPELLARLGEPLGISLEQRGETLSVVQFGALAEALSAELASSGGGES